MSTAAAPTPTTAPPAAPPVAPPAKQLSFPCRDCSHLYASSITVHCAMVQSCVACAYKVGCFDVALDANFPIPNKRPETCPRASKSKGNSSFYASNQTILTIGDGDLSLSLGLARMGCVVTATTLENIVTLSKTYPSFNNHVKELVELKTEIQYNVDATHLDETLQNSEQGVGFFDRILFYFPCKAVKSGQDGQNEEMEKNKKLIADFVRGARKYLTAEGQIHIAHKTKPPFNQWGIESIVSDACPELRYCGRIVFDRYLTPPYTPRKAMDRKSFPVHDACVYAFDAGNGGNPLEHNTIELKRAKKHPSPSKFLMVDPDLIDSLRSTMIKKVLKSPRVTKKRPRESEH